MDIAATSDADSFWIVKDLLTQAFPMVTVPSTVGFEAISGLDTDGAEPGGFEEIGEQGGASNCDNLE